MAELEAALQPWSRLVDRVRIRERANRGLRAAAWTLPIPLIFAVTALTVVKALWLGREIQQLLLAAAALQLVVALALTVVAMLRVPSADAASLALDRHFDLRGRVTSALEFGRLAEAARSPLMKAAIADLASRNATDYRAGAVRPIVWPRLLWLSAGLVAALALVARFEVRKERIVALPAEPETVSLTADDAAVFRAMGDQLARGAAGSDISAEIAQFRAIVEGLARGKLTQQATLEQIAELERQLGDGLTDKAALRERVSALAQALDQHPWTKATADALDHGNLEDAARALEELAERLRRPAPAPTRAELQRLRDTLSQPAQRQSEERAAIDAERERLLQQRKRLLDKKANGTASRQELSELEQTRRRLEKLERHRNRQRATQARTSPLDRKLAEAAKQLMKDLGRSADQLSAGAKALSEMEQRALTDAQKRQLLDRLQQLRDLLRKQGNRQGARRARLKRFQRHARGEQSERGPLGAGTGRARSESSLLVLGQGDGTGRAHAKQSEVAADGPPGTGAPPPAEGSRPGTRAGDDPRGQATDPIAASQDVAAAAVDTGQGQTSSQVIEGAAATGFVGSGYRNVYTDYETVAERVLERDQIPPGHRRYVQRYFQLIRPRQQ